MCFAKLTNNLIELSADPEAKTSFETICKHHTKSSCTFDRIATQSPVLILLKRKILDKFFSLIRLIITRFL